LSILLVALPIVGFASTADDQRKSIDAQRSILMIHVGKAGLFSAAAHGHWVNAPIANGIVDEASAILSVRFVVDAAKLTVMADKNLSAKELAEVQSNMQNKIRIIEVSQHHFPVSACTRRRSRRLESGWQFDSSRRDNAGDY
jgi:hypothetical protein